MRRFIVALCLILILICICSASLLHTQHCSNILSEKVKYISQTQPMDYVQVLSEIEELVVLWYECKNLLTHHVRHDDMNNIEAALVRAAVYANKEADILLSSELADLHRLFINIGKKEVVSLDNIL